jgi:hypothetical protein
MPRIPDGKPNPKPKPPTPVEVPKTKLIRKPRTAKV